MKRERIELDSPDTVLGQLQRGQGRGYLAAREAKDVDALLHCIHFDPRWDRQVEGRRMYYARLALELNVDVAAIAAQFAEDDDLNLTAGVLVELGNRGVAKAFEALRVALRSPNWRAAARALNWAQMEHEEALVDEADLSALMEHDTLRDIVWDTPEWRLWAEMEPRLMLFFPDAGRATEEVREEATPKPDTAMSTEALLAIVCVRNLQRVANVLAQRRDPESLIAIQAAGETGTPAQTNAALHALGAHRNASLAKSCFERARQTEPSAMERAGILRYLAKVPAEFTLPFAREFLEDKGLPGVIAARVLAKHAQAEDRERIEAEVQELLDRDDFRGVCNWADALGVIGSEESSALLEATYHSIVYSYARDRLIRALHACAPPVAIALAPDALYDSDDSTRGWAVQNAARTPRTEERFVEIATDEFEWKNITIAAARRLAEGDL